MRFLLKTILPFFLFAAAQPALADGASGPLAPGTAAGIHAAQSDSRLDKLAVVGTVGIIIVAAYLIAGTHYHVPGQSSGGNNAASGTH